MLRSISISSLVTFISSLATRGLLLVILAIAWMVGILLEDTLPIPPPVYLLLTGCFLLLMIIFWSEQRHRLPLLIFLFIGLGAWRCAQALPQYDAQSVQPLVNSPSTLYIRGIVTDEPKLQTRTRLLIISVNSIQTKGSTQQIPFDGTIEAITLFQDSSPEDPYGANFGDSVELTGKLLSPGPTSSKNILASMAFPRIFVSATGGSTIITTIYHLRNQMAILIEQALPQPEAAILIAIFLGLRTPALQPLRQAFNVTGTAHLIVPSGFKVTILSGLVAHSTGYILPEEDIGSLPFTPLHKNWRDWLKMVLILLSIGFYTVLSGAGPAALRAGIMGGLLVIAPRLGRQYNVYNGLAGAALAMTCIDPLLLWDVGFQLSFLGTLGIVLLTPYFQKLLQPLVSLPAGHIMFELAAVTIAAQIATLPIFAVAFQQVSLIAPIANILTVPLLGPLIILGLSISIAGFIFHPLSLLCGWIAWPFLWYVQAAIIQCSTRIYAFFTIKNFAESIAWLYYVLLIPVVIFLLYRYPLSTPKKHSPSLTRYNRRMLQVGCVVLIVVITGITIIAAPSPTSNTISFFNINSAMDNGQSIDTTKNNKKQIRGEAIFIRTQDGKTLLIDGGGDIVSLSQLLDSHLPSWQRSLDLVILTSPQQDTITGLQDVITRYQVGSVFDAGMAHPTTTYARWRRVIKQRNILYIPYKAVAQSKTILLGSTTQIQVLWPQASLHSGSNETRDNGLILRVVMPGLRLLLLGSSIQSSYALTNLLSSVDGNMLKSDVVQVLGEMDTQISASLTDVLKQAQPSLVVITSSTQHKTKTHKSTRPILLTLSNALASIPQTLQTGLTETPEIQLRSDSSGWTISD